MNIPAELKYTKDHEWVKIDGDIATVGITDFAQGELGDIVYVEVDTLDETLDRGEIIEFNESLEDEPEKVNSDPYGDGWMVKIKFSDATQLDDLLSDAAYKEIIGG